MKIPLRASISVNILILTASACYIPDNDCNGNDGEGDGAENDNEDDDHKDDDVMNPKLITFLG